MAAIHGKGTAVLVDEHDLTSFFNACTTDRGVEAAELTTYGNDDKVYIAGLEMGTVQLGGFWDGDAAAVDEALDGVLSDNSPVITVGLSGVAAVGDVATMLQGKLTTYGVQSSVNGPVTVSAAATADGGVRNGGHILHALGAETSTFNGSTYDGAASSAFGGAAHLHVTAFTGTSLTLKIQHSANGSTWADLVSWTVSAIGAQRTAVATGTTVNRYLRTAITAGTFTTITFATAFARNRR